MATIGENSDFWTSYDWSRRGDEWSEEWGGSANLFWGALYPRLARFLPSGALLEIAPGHGRMTEFLARLCSRLVLVELSPNCLAACRDRFAELTHLQYLTTDGKSLPGVADGTIDFAFSFDSLVHCNPDAVNGYVRELGRVLAPDGAAFLHHSNLGALVDPRSGELAFPNEHWRDTAVSAESVARAATEAGLVAVVQELVAWCGPHLIDSFTLLVRESGRFAGTPRVVDNLAFMQEAEDIRRSMALWNPDGLHLGPAR